MSRPRGKKRSRQPASGSGVKKRGPGQPGAPSTSLRTNLALGCDGLDERTLRSADRFDERFDQRAMRPATRLDKVSRYEKILADLDELQHDAVMAWDGAVPERSGFDMQIGKCVIADEKTNFLLVSQNRVTQIKTA